MELQILFRNLKVHLNNMKKSIVRDQLWILMLMATFLVSGLAYLLEHSNKARLIFDFPDTVSEKIISEYKRLPRKSGQLNRIRQYVEEYILGSANIRSQNILERATRVRAVYINKKNEVVIDLTKDVLIRPNAQLIDIREALAILENGIRKNFPRVTIVQILIEGQEPFVPPYRFKLDT